MRISPFSHSISISISIRNLFSQSFGLCEIYNSFLFEFTYISVVISSFITVLPCCLPHASLMVVSITVAYRAKRYYHFCRLFLKLQSISIRYFCARSSFFISTRNRTSFVVFFSRSFIISIICRTIFALCRCAKLQIRKASRRREQSSEPIGNFIAFFFFFFIVFFCFVPFSFFCSHSTFAFVYVFIFHVFSLSHNSLL